MRALWRRLGLICLLIGLAEGLLVESCLEHSVATIAWAILGIGFILAGEKND